MNKHVETMKKAVQGYYSALQDADAKMRRNSEIYQPDAARAENEKIEANLVAARQNAEAQIRSAVDSGKAEIDKWATPDGSQITPDAQLLHHDGLPLHDFVTLVERYKDNYNMSGLLQRYGDRQNERLQEANKSRAIPVDLYPTWTIRSAENRRDAYEKFGAGAIQAIGALNAQPGFGQGLQSDALKESIEHFGEPNSMNAHLLEML